MRSLRFRSTVVSKDDDCLMVAFGEPEDGSDDYIILQLAPEFDAQDRALGMDGLYFELNDQSHSGYKIITRIEVTGSAVILEFSASKIGLPEDHSPLRILPSETAQEPADLHTALKTMADSTGIAFSDTTP